ncbi:MAG TPA: cobalamin-binding protein [Nitrospiraceae bacterium]|jgi:iron complex transport system substrate-binding protein|nr:cobalamin-binding protein [Nitrospiraceae bacterium]
MRICSLLPSATEVIALLGLSDELVGISHECDYPPSVRNLPVMVEPMIPPHGLASHDIDRQVSQLVASGQRLYRLKDQLLRQAQPDLIVSQDLCHVCAVTPDQLHEALCSMPRQPTLLTLNPTTVHEVIADVIRIGNAANRSAEGRHLAEQLQDRLEAVRTRVQRIAHCPRVACIEWLSPLYVAGHWVPEMVQLAGGQDVLAQPGSASRVVTWDDVLAAAPEVLIVMPCGFSVERTQAELFQMMQQPGQWPLSSQLAERTVLVDASSYFSRPGPRLIDGIELLAAILHPSDYDRIDKSMACRLGPLPIHQYP